MVHLLSVNSETGLL